MFKKFISKTISFVLILSMIPLLFAMPSSASEEYTDVSGSRWSYSSVQYVSEKGYMNGVGGGKFDPRGSMTRAMLATVLWRIDGSVKTEGKTSFTDIPDGKWYSDAVLWAEKNGIVNGMSEGIFSPEGKITREQLAAMLYRYCNFKNYDTDLSGDLSTFSDKDKVHDYAAVSVGWALGAGLINGVSADTLDPRGNATREQVAVILERFDKTQFTDLVALYEKVVAEVADYTEELVRKSLEENKTDPDKNLFNWKDGLLVLGLLEAGRMDAVKEFVDTAIDSGDKPDAVDGGIVGYAVEELYERTADEKYGDFCKMMLEDFYTVPTDIEGEIQYSGVGDEKDGDDIYVDGTGMVGIFLGRYDSVIKDEKARQVAILQVSNYLKYGINKSRGYVYHGYNIVSSESGGEMGWGRGTGWLMLALGSVVRYCGDEEINEKCEDLITKTLKLTMDNGLFSWSLSRKNGPSDTSATGMIMWGILKAKEAGYARTLTMEMMKKTAKSTLDFIEGRVVYGSSGECAGWGVYSEKYNENNEWGQGSTLAILAMILRMIKEQ